jgi:hypothetical protein
MYSSFQYKVFSSQQPEPALLAAGYWLLNTELGLDLGDDAGTHGPPAFPDREP